MIEVALWAFYSFHKMSPGHFFFVGTSVGLALMVVSTYFEPGKKPLKMSSKEFHKEYRFLWRVLFLTFLCLYVFEKMAVTVGSMPTDFGQLILWWYAVFGLVIHITFRIVHRCGFTHRITIKKKRNSSGHKGER